MILKILVSSALLVSCLSLHVFDNPGGTMIREIQTDDGPVSLIVAKKRGRAVNFEVPLPFEVRSRPVTVESSNEDPSNRRGRQMQTMSIDEDGIPVIEGVRSPDDPTDTRVFRNARVINNVLVTDEDNEQNLISTILESQEEAAPSGRQGRILTGPVVFEDTKSESAAESNYEYPPFYYKAFYDPDRSGIPDTKTTDSGSSKNEEKVVSYSYSTSGGEVQQKSPKDVVYGSGFAAQPHKTSQSVPATPRFTNSNFAPPQRAQESFVLPSSFASGFTPISAPVRAPLFQSSSNNVPLPLNSVTLPLSSSSLVGSTSSFRVKNVNNNIAPNLPRPQFNQQSGGALPALPAPNSSFKRHQPSVNTNFGAPFNSPPLHTNQIRRHQQQSSVPTPHQAFGEAGSLIHPGIIPANSQDFIIQEATFQTHPGAPAFSVPIPRPASQSNSLGIQGQQVFNHPNHFAEYPYYQQGNYIEQIDNRPLIDKMIDPFRRVGERVREIASPVLDPVLVAGHRFGNRFRIPERMDKIASGNLDADAIPLVGGAVAVATLGALGAYAASKYSFDDLKRLLPSTAMRSTDSNANVGDILLKLAGDLESEEPSFLNRLSSSTSWLESSCSKRIFCTLVTSTISEEENKIIRDEEMQKSFQNRLGDKEGDGAEGTKEETSEGSQEVTLQSRQARRFLDREITYIERQINALIDGIKNTKNQRESKRLRDAAKSIVDAVKEKNCSAFSCS